jgi:Protein of unknown function (DUF3040)
MALSMDEQRMLAEIERRLAAEDPGLAARMSTFRRPGPVNVFRSARARVIGSLLTVAVVAMVSLMVYTILPFRSGSRTPSHQPVTTVSSTGQPRITAGSGKGPTKTSGQKADAGTSAAAKPASQAAAGTSQSPAAHASSGTAHAASGSGTTGIPSTFTGP